MLDEGNLNDPELLFDVVEQFVDLPSCVRRLIFVVVWSIFDLFDQPYELGKWIVMRLWCGLGCGLWLRLGFRLWLGCGLGCGLWLRLGFRLWLWCGLWCGFWLRLGFRFRCRSFNIFLFTIRIFPAQDFLTDAILITISFKRAVRWRIVDCHTLLVITPIFYEIHSFRICWAAPCKNRVRFGTADILCFSLYSKIFTVVLEKFDTRCRSFT